MTAVRLERVTPGRLIGRREALPYAGLADFARDRSAAGAIIVTRHPDSGAGTFDPSGLDPMRSLWVIDDRAVPRLRGRRRQSSN